ncbi:MAG: hypothetical protein JWP63_763 [Candidatus Solibacter sp.]|nr:hypothetical protein [Candidatus Solibacter sp.]
MAFYKRESPQDGQSVLLSESVVRGLRRLTIDGFVALPRRGIEVGGVLLGIADSEEVRLEGFEEVACEHRYGPSYALSESDRVKLHQLMAAWPSAKSPVVGFFRSFTSRDPVIEEADEAFVREHFPTGWFVYLMLQPLSVENCVASFRLFRDGHLLPDIEEPAWPFAVTENPPEPPSALPSLPAIENPPSLPPATPRRVHAEERDVAPLQRARWWVPALICLVSAAAGALITQMTNAMQMPAREPRWTDLHLDARPVDGRLEVRWDANPRTLIATRGRLEVTDGDSRRDIELDADQLRGGIFTYAPSNRDVRLRLSLYAKGSGIAGDTVRVKAIADLPVKPETKVSNEVNLAPSPGRPRAAQPSAAVSVSPSQVAVVPAELHEVQPQIPEGIRSRIDAPVIIPVEVEVSDRGQVVRAVAVRNQIDDSVHRYLAEQAQKAALKWRFRPARTTGGDRVAASKTLRFVFTP